MAAACCFMASASPNTSALHRPAHSTPKPIHQGCIAGGHQSLLLNHHRYCLWTGETLTSIL